MGRPRDDDKAVEVYLAHKQEPQLTLVALAARFGIAHSTVRRYLEAGRAADQWVAQFDRGEIATTVHGALAELLHSAIEDANGAEDGKERALHRQVALGVIDRVMRLHGLAAPTRVQVEDAPKPPDPDFVERIRAARARGDRELRADLDPDDEGVRY